MLQQLPHFTKELAARCKEEGIESIFDISEMDVRSPFLYLLTPPCPALPDFIINVCVPPLAGCETSLN